MTSDTLVPEVIEAVEDLDGTSVLINVELEFNFSTNIAGATPAASKWVGALNLVFGPGLHHGIKAVRKIQGQDTWSQHAYGNAVDTMCTGELHRQIAYFAHYNRGFFSVAHLLADPYFESPLHNHYDHVHVDFFPQGTGSPYG